MIRYNPVAREDAICIYALRKTATDTIIPNNNSFEFGRMLELQYHLLEHVFKFLETKDLHSASLINPTWDKAAKWELQKRTAAAWISCSYRLKDYIVQTSRGFKWNNTAICIIAYSPETIKLKKRVCLHDVDIQKKMTFAEYIEAEVIADKIDYCTVSSKHVSPSNIAIKNVKLLYQGICIPFIPKMRTTMFYYNPEKKDQLSNYVNDSEQVKCLLVFSKKYRMNAAEYFFGALLKGQNPKKVAMGGGLIKSTKTSKQNNLQGLFPEEDLFCIAFLQNEGIEADFNAYSTVIISNEDESGTKNIDPYKPFETELLKLKETSVLRKHGTIFRFCCFAKSFKTKETQIIEKHFPDYPLLGLEVDGEIGWNSLNAEEEESGNAPEASSRCKKFKAKMPQSLHSWSTVLVLITWGKKL